MSLGLRGFSGAATQPPNPIMHGRWSSLPYLLLPAATPVTPVLLLSSQCTPTRSGRPTDLQIRPRLLFCPISSRIVLPYLNLTTCSAIPPAGFRHPALLQVVAPTDQIDLDKVNALLPSADPPSSPGLHARASGCLSIEAIVRSARACTSASHVPTGLLDRAAGWPPCCSAWSDLLRVVHAAPHIFDKRHFIT